MCRGLFPNYDPEGIWIAVMAEYAFCMEAGGHPDDQPYVGVARFLATEQQGLEFEPVWKATSERRNLGAVSHVVDFGSGKPRGRGAVLEHLTGIINRRKVAHFSCFVPVGSYKKVNEIYAMGEYLGTPYGVAAHGALVRVNSWKKKNRAPRAARFHLWGGALDARATWMRCFDGTKLGCRSWFGNPIPVSTPKNCWDGRFSVF